MGNILEANVELVNEKLKFKCKAKDNPQIFTDYIPPLGDNEGYMPLELFLISFAACVGGVVAPFLRKMGKSVTALSINASGKRRELHPTGFEKIDFHIQLKSPDATEADLLKVLKMGEDTYCPVWSMVKNNVEVSTTYTITKG